MTVKKAIIILVVLTIIGLIAVFSLTSKKDNIEFTSQGVERGKITQTVSETGTVKADSEIELSFINSGKVEKINVLIGDMVEEGKVLAALDSSSFIIRRQEAQANLDIANENLKKLISGATNEDIAIIKASVQQALTNYEATKKELEKTKNVVAENTSQAEKTLNDLVSNSPDNITTYEQAISQSETDLANSISIYQNTIDNNIDKLTVGVGSNLAVANTALDIIDRTVNDDDGKDLISVKDKKYLTNTISQYESAIKKAMAVNDSLVIVKASSNNSNSVKLGNDTHDLLELLASALENCFKALENSVTSSGFTQSELDALKSGISVQQTLINAGISGIQTLNQTLESSILTYNTNISLKEEALLQTKTSYDNAVINANNALSTSKINGDQSITLSESRASASFEAWQSSITQLNKILAMADQYDLALARARVRQAEAVLSTVQKQIEDSIIKAPINGIITKINYDVSEQTTPTKPAISMLKENNFMIEVLISEADIAKVEKGDKAEVTLDSFGDDYKFMGEVAFIEPAETIIQDVIYYKIEISFENTEMPVKSGMTANIIITTNEKDNVLLVSSRAIIDRNGSGKFVRVVLDGQFIEKKITTGLKGDEGQVEVLSGIRENDEVITYYKENN